MKRTIAIALIALIAGLAEPATAGIPDEADAFLMAPVHATPGPEPRSGAGGVYHEAPRVPASYPAPDLRPARVEHRDGAVPRPAVIRR